MEVQAEQLFSLLSQTLARAGSAMDHVVKVEVHLADVNDFYDFNLAWKNAFRSSAPARTVIEVGHRFPHRDALISLDAVAIRTESGIERETLRDPQGPDPMDAEGAPWAVRAGNLVFCSGFPAIDFRRGLAVGKIPGLPNYGNDAVEQATYVFDALNRVLAQAGTSLEQALESILYEPKLETFYDIDTVWPRYMPTPPGRAALGVKGLTVPGACFVASLTVLVPDSEHVKEESTLGIAFHPTKRMRVNYSPTLKAGPWLYIAGKTAGNMRPVGAEANDVERRYAPPGLPYHYSDVEIQTRNILGVLKTQIEANGSDWNHCHHVRVWLTNPERDYRGFMRVWREHFPDPQRAPALAYVPANEILYPGPVIEIDPTCVLKS
jgi:enamine deaminase RidA (YjgF/YER057c/UK114 family)